MKYTPFLSLIVLSGISCTSFRTTLLQRLDNDSVTPACVNKQLKGVPVKLKVPTHLDVTITETIVFIKEGTGASLIAFEDPQIEVATNLVYTDKVFLVDFKRPAAGTLDLSKVEFDQEQYFKEITATVEERTIRDISESIDTLKPALQGLKTSSGEVSGDIIFEKSVIAKQRFDINEPDWEARMQAFVDGHLNGVCPPAHKMSADPDESPVAFE